MAGAFDARFANPSALDARERAIFLLELARLFIFGGIFALAVISCIAFVRALDRVPAPFSAEESDEKARA